MSEQRISQRTSDFSIARILSGSSVTLNQKKLLKVQDFLIHNKQVKAENEPEECANVDETRTIIADKDELEKVETLQSESVNRNLEDEDFEEDDDERFGRLERKLPWLQCTRYSPPKLPRRPTAGKQRKRRLGSHPRIPFTKFQIQVLEEKYHTSAYLSRRDVIQLGGILNLPQNRVKIWFQNRRARERKESQSNPHNRNLNS